MNTILNIPACQFVPLPDAQALRQTLHRRAQDLQLKGTILLAEEGINLFLAGPAAAVRGFVDERRADPRFCDLCPKESWSTAQPFRQMRVKIKPEIIRMNHPTIRPDADPGGRAVVTLEPRNAFEVDPGNSRAGF